MAANEPLNQLETTDANNTPIGTDVIGSSLDDELRSIKANIARSAREESTATASAAATLAVTVLNKIVPVSGSAAGSTTITLPAAATAGAGFRFTAWKTDNTNDVIIDASGAETINGSADYTMATQYEAAQFVTDGTSWIVESTAKRELGTSDLADDSVTNAKLANMAQDTIKGRATAGTGDPEDLTPAQARTLLDVYQQATADGLFVNVSGDTMAGDLSFGDNNKAQFGAANDLEIFHNATDSVINDAGTGSLKLQNTGSTKLEVTTTGIDVTGNVVSDGADLDGAVTINESGADVDFRVESAVSPHSLFINGANGKVGLGNGGPQGALHVNTTDAGTNVATQIFATLPGTATQGFSRITLQGRQASVDYDNNISGSYGLGLVHYSPIKHSFNDGTNYTFGTRTADTVVNEDGIDHDFRVESVTNTHALFVQGSDGAVGINTSAPAADLHITDRTGAAVGAAQIKLSLDAASTDGFSGLLLASRSGGTDYSPTILTDYLGGINYESPRRHYFDCNAVEVLSAGAASVIVNDPGNDVDFRVESATNTHALFVQGSNGFVGIGESAPEGNLHIKQGSGSGTSLTINQPLVVDCSGFGGISIQNPNTATGYILFGDPDDVDQGQIFYAHSDDNMYIRTASATRLQIGSGLVMTGATGGDKGTGTINATTLYSGRFLVSGTASAETVINEDGNDHDFRVESDTNTHALFVQGSDGFVGINESSPGGVLHISNPSTPGSSSSYPVNGDELILEGANNVGMTIIGGTLAGARIYMGVVGDEAASQLTWDGANGEFLIRADYSTDTNPQMKLKQGVQVGAPTGGYKGTGTINATAVYDDNTLLTDFVLDQAVDGEIDFDFYDSLELGGKAAREWDARNLDIDHYEAQWRERKALPSFRSKAERFDSEGKEIRDSVGTLIQGLQQELETAMVHIAQLNARIKQLEEK